MRLFNFRMFFFRVNDFFHGSPIQKAYDKIKYVDNLDVESEEMKKHREESLSKLLATASRNVPFYKQYKDCDFLNLPIVNKLLIKENKENFLSTAYDNGKLFSMTTSGSTGIPFCVVQNIEKKKSVNAEVFYYGSKAGYQIGNKLLYLRGVTKAEKKNYLISFIKNIWQIDISNLTKEKINGLLQYTLQDGDSLLSYASTLDFIKKEIQKNNYKNTKKLNSIISSSEVLYRDTRKIIENYFNTRVTNRYSNQENGIIAQDSIKDDCFEINEANYYIEILDFNKDTPVSQGELGRICVTDYKNFSMPLIRYDTGDVGCLVVDKIGGINKLCLTKLSGRKSTILLDSLGDMVANGTICNVMRQYSKIIQYQLIQTDCSVYELILNMDRDYIYTENTLIVNELKSVLGKNAKIQVKYVDEIPVLSSGKRQYIINKMVNKTC